MGELGEKMNIKILFEDNHIIVIEKPINVPTQEDESGDIDMLSLVKQYIKEKYNKPGNVFLGLVHRLDRPVGGVMIFARTTKAASRLSEQVRGRQFKKTYLAIVHGKPEKQKDTLTNYLLKDSNTNTVKIVRKDVAEAKEAILDYEVLQTIEGLSLLKINLRTGRPHQIRVQLTNIGNPLWGDQKYGQQLNKPGQQIALWASEIAIVHPITKKEELFCSLPPKKHPWNDFRI